MQQQAQPPPSGIGITEIRIEPGPTTTLLWPEDLPLCAEADLEIQITPTSQRHDGGGAAPTLYFTPAAYRRAPTIAAASPMLPLANLTTGAEQANIFLLIWAHYFTKELAPRAFLDPAETRTAYLKITYRYRRSAT